MPLHSAWKDLPARNVVPETWMANNFVFRTGSKKRNLHMSETCQQSCMFTLIFLFGCSDHMHALYVDIPRMSFQNRFKAYFRL